MMSEGEVGLDFNLGVPWDVILNDLAVYRSWI